MIFAILALIAIWKLEIGTPALGAAPRELFDAIEAKNKELAEISRQRQEAQKNLQETVSESRVLTKQIQNIGNNLNQLNLGIKSSEIKIQKLNLETNSLNYDITDIEEGIDGKKEAVVKILREIQQKDEDNLLTIFLKNGTLADGISEIQGLSELNVGLSAEIKNLKNLGDALNEKLESVTAKKEETERENGNLRNKKAISEEQKKERQTLFQLNKKKEVVFQQKIEELEKQQEEILTEIDKIETELRAKLDPSLIPIGRSGVLTWPVVLKAGGGFGVISQNFGNRSAFYGGKPHNGMDIAAPMGTEIFAADNGTVAAVGNTDEYCPPRWYGKKKYGGSYGKYVVVKHSNNLTTMYAHLSRQAVGVGDAVRRGEIIGYVGSTGLSTGSHLHFTVYASPSFYVGPSNTCGLQPYGASLDPANYL